MSPISPTQGLDTDKTVSYDIKVTSPSQLATVSSLPLHYQNSKRATGIISNLIQEIEESTPQDTPIQSLTLGFNENIERARPSLRVKPLVYVKFDSTQASSAESTPMAHYTAESSPHRSMSFISQQNSIDTMALNVFRDIRSTTASTKSTPQNVHFMQSTPRLQADKQQKSHTPRALSKQSNELKTPPLNAGYMDPRLQNAVKRYRPQSTPPDSRSVRSPTSTGSSKYVPPLKQTKRHASQPPSVKLKPVSSNKQQVSPIDLKPPGVRLAQHRSNESSIKNPRSWISAKLATSRNAQKERHGGSRSENEDTDPTSIPKKSFICRHLGGHPTPQLTPNFQKKDVNPTLQEKVTNSDESKALQSCCISPQIQTRVDFESQAALPGSPKQIGYQNLRFDKTIPQPPANDYPLTFRTKDGQQISIPRRSLCSITRSASRRSDTTSRYRGGVRSVRNSITAPVFGRRPLITLQIPEEPSANRGPITRRDCDVNSPLYSPVNYKDLGYVDFWLESTNSKCSSPNDPCSPLFSERSTSTASSSPIGSSEGRGSVELDSSRSSAPSRKNATIMQSCITHWETLDGCTPQFVQSMNNMMGNGRSQTPGLDSPTSQYFDNMVPIEFQDCAPQVIAGPVESKFGSFDQASSQGKFFDPNVSPNETKPQVDRSFMQSPVLEKPLKQCKIWKLKPHVAQLIIPASPPSNIKLQGPFNKMLPPLPDIRPPTELAAEVRTEDMVCSAETPTWSTEREEALQRYRSASASSSSSFEEKTLVLAMTPSIPTDAIKTFPSTYYKKPTTLTSPNPKEEDHSVTLVEQKMAHQVKDSYSSSVPARLTRPLGVWNTPGLLAPKGGLQLRVSRHHLTSSKHEWVVKSAVSYTSYLRCIGQTNSLTRKRDFWDMDGNLSFGFQRTVGSTRVAESHSGQTLFVVRNASLKLLPHWTLTYKSEEDGSAQWVARGDEECRSLVVFWGGFLVGRISVESKRLRNNYIVTINPEMNYCMMVALATVFDDLRVDEGFF